MSEEKKQLTRFEKLDVMEKAFISFLESNLINLGTWVKTTAITAFNNLIDWMWKEYMKSPGQFLLSGVLILGVVTGAVLTTLMHWIF